MAAPSGATGKDNLVIPVGAADAPSTLTIYEDFRCPACDAFEKTLHADRPPAWRTAASCGPSTTW